MKVFKTIKPGMFTTIQDLGRYGHLKYGVPISGAMDPYSMIMANLLVENNPNDSCIEMTLIGPELTVLRKTQIAITGGNLSPKINGENVPMWQTIALNKSDVISFGQRQNGCRAYLSVRGGVNVPNVLGSKSTYVRGGFGGLDGRQLRKDDIIKGYETPLLRNEYSIPKDSVPQFTGSFIVHVILGPQDDMFTDAGVNTFLSKPYKVTLASDRMGYRLEGEPIEHKTKADIVSDALLPGAVQVPKDGKPIIIMRDAQTTGGYAKIAVVATPDLSVLGQAKPNDKIEFSNVTLSQVQLILREFNRQLNMPKNMLLKKPLAV
jgi:biotin-dependent carboxylase-like uncharacterized protein